jgi:hypothetical protein
VDVAGNFIILISGTFAFLEFLFPITLTVAGLWAWGLVVAVRRPNARPLRVAGWCLLPAVLTAGVMTVGAVCVYRGDEPPAALPGYLIVGLVLAHVPLAGVLGWRAGNQWPVVVTSWAAWGWVSVCAALVAGMSVTGNWL